MPKLFVLPRCPNCRARSSFFHFRVYRCQVCSRLCCDECIDKSWLGYCCPHCRARSSMVQVGYID